MRSIAILLLTAALSTSWAGAQVPAGPEFRVDTPDPFWMIVHSPSVASAADGDFVLTWACARYNYNCWHVPARSYDASGVARGEEFSVGVYGYLDTLQVSVASDAAGRFVIVWNDYETHLNPPYYGVSAALFDASGQERSEFLVNTSPVGMEAAPAAAFDGAGNFVVVWVARQMVLNSPVNVFAQRYDASGTPRGSEFQVNTNTITEASFWPVPAVASDASGNMTVVWPSSGPDGSEDGIFAQRFDATGAKQGAEFQVNTWTSRAQVFPSVAADAAGNFVVAWESGASIAYPPPPDTQDGSAAGIYGQRYDASGTPVGAEFRVNTYTTGDQSTPTVASDATGDFVVAWSSWNQDGQNSGVFAQRFDRAGVSRGAEFQVNEVTAGNQGGPSVASDVTGNFVVAWSANSAGIFAQRFGGIQPAASIVDPSPSSGSDGNGVLETGESVAVRPSWRNLNGATQTFDATATSFDGPPASGVSYELQDAAGAYGTVADGAVAQCSNCYQVAVQRTGARPATHWDATLVEAITPDTLGQVKPWRLHVGESFTDAPKTNSLYAYVETLLHNGVASGCTANTYCPAVNVTRQQAALFTLLAKEGRGYLPAPCGATSTFVDVPVTSPYCRWVGELARRGVVGGCGGGNFCPTSPVTRAQMPIFVLKALDPTIDPPACSTAVFADVPASSPYCRWITALVDRGIVAGCGGGNYCPTSPVNRGQMAVFVSRTFGLTLYGP
jgi:hypothetical protein